MVKVMLICIAPHETSLRRSGIERIVKGYHTLRFIGKWNEPYPLLPFPTAAGTHLLPPEGWKAE